MLTEIYVNSATLIIVAVIAGIPAVLGAYWGYKAKNNSAEARVNSVDAKVNSAVAVVNSAEAKLNSAAAKVSAEEAVYELKANGGMLAPNPTMNDKLNYVIELVESDSRRLDKTIELLDTHINHSNKLEAALLEQFLTKPRDPTLDPPRH